MIKKQRGNVLIIVLLLILILTIVFLGWDVYQKHESSPLNIQEKDLNNFTQPVDSRNKL
jgi:Tfp pilus assembly protein PilX